MFEGFNTLIVFVQLFSELVKHFYLTCYLTYENKTPFTFIKIKTNLKNIIHITHLFN